MKKTAFIILSIFLISSIVLMLTSWESASIDIYVSPNGNDKAIGDIDHPVKSLERAAEVVRKGARKIPVNVYLSGGYYRLKKPLELGVLDGGTKDAPVNWQALSGEKPIISGGIPIQTWKKENNELWSARMPANFKGNFRAFFVNDKRAIRARFPDQDFLKVLKTGEDKRTNFFFEQDDIPKVKNPKELELVFMHDWSITRIGVGSIDWKKNQLFAVDSIGSRLSFFTIDNWGEHPRYYLENAKEFCDSPGEWYFDIKERKIYYYPMPNDNFEDFEGVIPVAEKLLSIKGTKDKRVTNISFKDIVFAHTNWQIPDKGYCGIQACMYDDRANIKKSRAHISATIEIDRAKNCGIYNSVIKHTGGSGIWIRENNLACEIVDTHIFDISGNGINIGEGSERQVDDKAWWQSAPEQVTKHTKISNCLIENSGTQFYGAVGIWGGLIANTIIENNEIKDLPYTGISIGWMWNATPTPCRENIINANHIHHIMNKLSDGGGIYCLGLQPDSKIINNLIHDVTVNAGRAESNGMFLDEGISNILVENNIVYNIARSPLRFHKAFENKVQNNIFVCGDGIPPIKYNRTKEEDIKKIDNIVLSQSSKEDMDKLQGLIKERSQQVGPKIRYIKHNKNTIK